MNARRSSLIVLWAVFLIAGGIGSGWVLGFVSGAGAQEIRHGDMPIANRPGKPGADRPHAGIAMPEPMEEPIPDANVPLATETKGAQPLRFRTERGVKVFELTAKPVKWLILPAWRDLPDVRVTAWTYNGQVPGPLIRVTAGDWVRIILKNELPVPTSIHWHGIRVPNAMDGVADPPITQKPVKPGETFTYEFTVKDPGTFFYHSHVETDRQIPAGLAGPFIVDSREQHGKTGVDYVAMLQEWRVDSKTGKTWPAMPAMSEPNFFTINGKAFPATDTITVKKGERVRIRFIGANQFAHPMHLHGFPFKIVATDGFPVPSAARLTKDTIMVGPGERYDIEFVAAEPGSWLIHCHIFHHVTNDDREPGGLVMTIKVVG